MAKKSIKCQLCDRICKGGTGYASHMRHSHPDFSKVPITPVVEKVEVKTEQPNIPLPVILDLYEKMKTFGVERMQDLFASLQLVIDGSAANS